MLTKNEFYARHAQSPKWAALSKEAKKARYQGYLKSTAGAVAFRQATPKATKKALGKPSGGSGVGKAYVKSSGYAMNPRTHDFLTARMNPFCPRISNVGYPSGVPAGTVKARIWARGSLQTNAAGFGSIMLSTGSATGGTAAVQYSSSAAYPMITDAFPNPGAAGTSNQALTGVPIPVASAGPSTLVRIVAAGIRIRNTTPLLLKGGSAKSICYPLPLVDLSGVTGAQCLTQFAKYSNWYDLANADTPWYSAVWSPTIPSEAAVAYGLQTLNKVDGAFFPLASVLSINNNIDLGILIAVPTVGVSTFDWEVVEWVEYMGAPPSNPGTAADLINSMTTQSTPDPLGLSITSMANQTMIANAEPKTTEGAVTSSSILSSLGNAARAVLGNSTPSDFLGSLLSGSGSSSGASSMSAPTSEGSLEGWATDSSSGLFDELTSRFTALTGREAGATLEGVGEAMAMML